MSKKPSMEWRFAYPDCRSCYKTITFNDLNYSGVFDVKRTSFLWLSGLFVSIVFTIGGLIWNFFSKDNLKIGPSLFAIVLGSILVLTVVAHFLYCFLNNIDVKACESKIIEYQGIWPAIKEVVEDNINNLLLPDEPLRADDIEVKGEIVTDDTFINHRYDVPYRKIDDEEVEEETEFIEEPEAVALLPEKSEQTLSRAYAELMKDKSVVVYLEPDRVPTTEELMADLRRLKGEDEDV